MIEIDEDELRSRLICRPRTLHYSDISKSVGISVSWLTKFARNRLEKSPRIETLHKLKTALDTFANV